MNIFDILRVMFFEINNNLVLFERVYGINSIKFETYDDFNECKRNEIRCYDGKKSNIGVFELFYNRNDVARLYVDGDKFIFIINNEGYKIERLRFNHRLDTEYCEIIFHYIVSTYNLKSRYKLDYRIYNEASEYMSYKFFKDRYIDEIYGIQYNNDDHDIEDICIMVGYNEYLVYKDNDDCFELIFKNGTPVKIIYTEDYIGENNMTCIWSI